jgi:hypothetical protein
MALFCTLTKIAPSEFKKLTLTEYIEFLKVIEERNGTAENDEWPQI